MKEWKNDWEPIFERDYWSNETYRLFVPSGWVVRYAPAYNHTIAMCFVPDPTHEWKLEEIA